MGSIQENNLLNRHDAARYLGGICLTILNRLKIPKLKIRRRTFYRLVDLNNWVSNNALSCGDSK